MTKCSKVGESKSEEITKSLYKLIKLYMKESRKISDVLERFSIKIYTKIHSICLQKLGY